ncbi:hypothetical protein Pst134EB_005744 [Puccinia striiformis f. sp. tritici]|nr:hypothetical protein Pst134EB_005744 [Puccinia striiformis f. sp. tritici]
MEDPQDPSTLISGDASIRKTKAVKLPKEVVNLSNNRLKEHITSASIKFYHDEPKDLQVQAVSALVRGENCFLRAGTGYGKTRISEMYYMLFKSKVVVLVLNPYSGTRNATFQVMKVVNEAHLTRKHEYDPVNGFIRRYHSCTGDEDKEANMADYADTKFPIMSSTMALGLGQNLKRVRCVIHMGRGDPASIAQMVGRCGRDGKPGLALLFMEATRKNGKNNVAAFDPKACQGEDNRMDALAVGGTCIRVSFAMDSKNGYVPLSVDDPNYRLEQARELHVGLPPCDCSICMPLHAQAILRALPQVDEDHLDALLKDPFSFVIDESIKTLVRKRKSQRVKGTCKYPTVMAANLSAYLVQCFVEFFDRTLGRTRLLPSHFFGPNQANSVVESINQIRLAEEPNLHLLERLMGGRFFPNHVEFINQSITNWISGDYYQGILAKSEAEHKAMEQEAEQLREQKAVQAAEKQRDAKIAKEMKMDAKRFLMVSKQKEDEKARKAVAAHKKQERQKKAGTTRPAQRFDHNQEEGS